MCSVCVCVSVCECVCCRMGTSKILVSMGVSMFKGICMCECVVVCVDCECVDV